MATKGIKPPEEFNFSCPSDWPTWKRQFDNFVKHSNIKRREEKYKVNLLIYLMGEMAEDIFASFNLSSADTMNYDKVIGQLDIYFQEENNKTCEKAKFISWVHQEEESIESSTALQENKSVGIEELNLNKCEIIHQEFAFVDITDRFSDDKNKWNADKLKSDIPSEAYVHNGSEEILYFEYQSKFQNNYSSLNNYFEAEGKIIDGAKNMTHPIKTDSSVARWLILLESAKWEKLNPWKIYNESNDTRQFDPGLLKINQIFGKEKERMWILRINPCTWNLNNGNMEFGLEEIDPGPEVPWN